MTNEKIVQITATSGEVYGLTESGGLAHYDKNLGKFVLKTSGEIMGEDRANVLKRPNCPTPSAPEGRYRSKPGEAVIVDHKKGKIMIDYVMVAAGVAALALLLYFVAR